jgi:hypothetical protein
MQGDPVAIPAPAGQSIADKVLAQLGGDYPKSALKWVSGLQWSGPSQVPLTQIDWSTGKPDWDAAAADTTKIAQMKAKLRTGWAKPVVLIRTPGSRLLYVLDGHGRSTASKALGRPVMAWIGTAKTATGPWQSMHSQQLPDT